MSKQYTVEYEKDEDGMWIAVIDRAQGVSCVAQGRSLGEARRRIRSALGVYLDDAKAAETAELIDDVKLPAKIKTAVSAVFREREKARAAQELSLQKASVASELLERQGLSRRDAAELLGVSHQRIQQIVQVKQRHASRSLKQRAERVLALANRVAAASTPKKKTVAKSKRTEARESVH